MIKLKKYSNRSNATRNKRKLKVQFKCKLSWKKNIIKNKAGRNQSGKKTVRSKGRGIKNFYPVKINNYSLMCPGIIIQFVWHSRLTKIYALVKFITGAYGLIPAVQKLAVKDKINYRGKNPSLGSITKLKNIRPSTFICNIELKKLMGAQLVKSPGTRARLLRPRIDKFARVRLPSSLILNLSPENYAQIGKNVNHLKKRESKGKAGFNRKIGKHPSVRGIAMNPNSHPHGGNSGPGRSSVTPWGKPTK